MICLVETAAELADVGASKAWPELGPVVDDVDSN
jgi:hypothetical protein